MSWQVNRAAQLWRNWEDKEKMLLDVFGQDKISADLTREKYEFLSAGIYRVSGNVSLDEKLVLGLIRKSVNKLEKQLYPHPIVRFAHKVKRFVFDRSLADFRFQKLKAQNLATLGLVMEKLGFDPEKIRLDKFLDYERPEMSIPFSSPYGLDQRFQLSLHLEKGEGGHYQLNGYIGMLRSATDSDTNRSFRFESASEITIYEADNLLQGRAVLKSSSTEFGGAGAKWVQLDFSGSSVNPVLCEVSEGAGFNLKQQVDLIAEKLNRPELGSAHVLKGLEQGKQVAMKTLNGQTIYLEASPLAGKVLLRNSQQQEVSLEKLVRQRDKSLTAVPELKVSRSLDKRRDQSQSLGIA